MTANKEALKGHANTLVLSLLNRKDMYGYEIIKELHLISEGFFDFKEGTLYPILHALEINQSVEAYWVESENGRPRKYYRITKAGKLLFKEKRKEWDEFTKAVSNVLGMHVCLSR